MSEQPRTHLANLINDVMCEEPSPPHAAAMAAVTPRKLWIARPEDCVVTLAPCSNDFRDYVAETLGMTGAGPELIQPDEVVAEHACAVVERMGAVDRVAGRPVLVPFVVDDVVVEFARRTGTSLYGYQDLPTAETLQAIKLINTKSGFRKTASGLGLPVARGGFVRTREQLVHELSTFSADGGRAIVKQDRSSNGHRTFVVDLGSRSEVEERVEAELGGGREPRCGWVYEEYLPLTAVPSIEMVVRDVGVRPFYSCDQRTRNNAWTGMVTPADGEVLRHSGSRLLEAAATAIGTWLFERGYRGYFDVDCGLTESGYVVTEANVRRTGGTYLHELARRLYPDGPVFWNADARTGSGNKDFAAGLRAVRRANLDEQGVVRVLLLVDTLATDGKWRYLCVGADPDIVKAAEHELESLLELN